MYVIKTVQHPNDNQAKRYSRYSSNTSNYGSFRHKQISNLTIPTTNYFIDTDFFFLFQHAHHHCVHYFPEILYARHYDGRGQGVIR